MVHETQHFPTQRDRAINITCTPAPGHSTLGPRTAKSTMKITPNFSNSFPASLSRWSAQQLQRYRIIYRCSKMVSALLVIKSHKACEITDSSAPL
ncbi:hypothetical protein RRG08_017230 [Elysia crispata]|uniref:Uncharacterized protein n=1 Tax=Elysia crispata TaxID=231223 RepID=A0AAE0Z5W8_9GAST|nr:hypothetical protein RRG08_017230 [Elysia crispata]